MWLLKCNERTFYIRRDKGELIIGRNAGISDLVLTGDASVSRRHAILRCNNNNELILQNLETKYGTFLNQNIETKVSMANNECTNLNENDKIRFGILENVWTVHYIPLITCTSTMKGENLECMMKDLDVIGATFKSEWDDSCTHLTMPTITLTAKVLAALASECYIVTAQFWKAWRKVVTDGGTPPDAADYLPEVIENTLNKENVSFNPDSRRKSLFIGKKFIFFSRKQMNFYKTVLVQCGASVHLLSESKLTKSKLCEDNTIVIQFSTYATGQETQSQRQIVDDIVNYMHNKSRRVIPDVEIGLAVLLISTEKYCNPKRNISAMFNKQSSQNEMKNENILAAETQPSTSNSKNQHDVVIEESLISNNDSTLNSSHTSAKELGGPKRKNENIDSLPDRLPKKPKSNESFTKSSTDEDIFDFVSEAPKTAAAASSVSNKSSGKKLDFMKPKKKIANNDDNFFNFLSVDSNKDQSNQQKTVHQSSLFSAGGNKRKLENFEEPVSKKINAEISKTHEFEEFKADFKELLKHSFWKSCREEVAKQEIKSEVNEPDESALNCGEAVVSICQNLIVKNEDSVCSNDNTYSGRNFKKFKKVFPLKMQMVVIPSSSMSICRPEPLPNIELQSESSDDDEDIRNWMQNKKGRKQITRAV